MLLGYIVSQRGIEANPEKVSAITKMGLIRDVKGVQKVTGVWQHSAASSHGGGKKRYHCTDF